MSEQGYTDAPRPWYVVKSRGHAFLGAGGATTVAPFWRPVHVRNLISLLLLKRAERRGA